jgi:hypothetical protein
MAKSKIDTTPAAEDSIRDMELVFDGHRIFTNSLPDNSMRYLLQYGFAQCLQDMSAAQIRAQAERKGLEMTTQEVTEALEARRAEKVKNLLNGTIFVRKAGAPRATSFDKVVATIVKERLTAAVLRKGVALPKGDAYHTLAEGFMAKYGDDVRAEAQRRLDTAVAIDVDDLGDLF